MVIYGFSNGFYRWSTPVRVPTSEVWGQVLNIFYLAISKNITTKGKIPRF
ncbi:hypothetical protein LEP1GSC108_2297 [Leptospira weilii str. UI 13098]|uniref:Uncharacterized protein n=1 Tax=Leptospira weilii str. UI 13098 TaxID=1088542 RepID=M6Q558_9LEPT|nr:hypothetical protein LEP1GSC086_4107 [Leptospira weilii str. LNT 1234]EMN90731.1 hypothetical protein LEP1GSC108_2297 [Leptospira weilii str. UI 13098]